ncbi:hypothetical protein CAEBREN_17872 [Caenorhabditis brenneri]|uniref:Uncharacterized protein n=1 Tax=Caenorhabditis brenneri TaxID=135651 RepID=G0PCW2_CAEBE|nr:hypothetical protein CAEBREN_17872 [Caenorhabditis brenneri]
MQLPSLLFILSTFSLICHVASEDATLEANHLMNLLKQSIDFQQFEAFHGFMSYEFTWDTCKKVLKFDDYIAMLKKMSAPTKGGWSPMSTEWTVTGAHFKNHALYFKIHNVNQKYAYYPDLNFEAKTFDMTPNQYTLTRGKLGKCGQLE